MDRNKLAWIGEALFSGYYVVVTRGYVPLFLASVGMDIRDILVITSFANASCLLIALLINMLRHRIEKCDVRKLMIVSHGVERIAWGLIPLAYASSLYALTIDYVIALGLTIPTAVFMNLTLLRTFDPESLKKIYAIRNSLSAVSSIIGQVVSIAIVAILPSALKYVYIYVLAMCMGLIGTLFLMFSSKPKIEMRIAEEEQAIELSTPLFLFLVLFLASSSVIATAWGPYLMRVLHASEFIAASLGLVQTVTTIGASVFWCRQSYTRYRLALAIAAVIPLIVALTPIPLLHLGLAAAYAVVFTGGNFLASFVFAELAQRMSVFRASILLTTAGVMGQSLGCGVAALVIGIDPLMLFATASIFSVLALTIAFLCVPAVAVVPENYVRMYARTLHFISMSSYSFTIFIIKSYVVLTLRLLLVATALLVLYTVYRMIYHLIQLIR